jgi:hypothetical protein
MFHSPDKRRQILPIRALDLKNLELMLKSWAELAENNSNGFHIKDSSVDQSSAGKSDQATSRGVGY